LQESTRGPHSSSLVDVKKKILSSASMRPEGVKVEESLSNELKAAIQAWRRMMPALIVMLVKVKLVINWAWKVIWV
jgi:hypothetical protein